MVLKECLQWLLAKERSPRFRPVRTKDRLSRGWDAEMSGGNRDVMINGWLELGGVRSMIVEVPHPPQLDTLLAELCDLDRERRARLSDKQLGDGYSSNTRRDGPP